MAKHGEEKIQEALRSFALSGSYSETSREVGVPISTVRRWAIERSGELAAIKQEYLAACSDNFVKEAIEFKDQFGSGVRDKLLDCIDAVERVLKKPKLTGHDLATLIRELTRALQLIEGEPTERVEHTVWDKIEAKMEEEG